eukprot:gene6230-6054_t
MLCVREHARAKAPVDHVFFSDGCVASLGRQSLIHQAPATGCKLAAAHVPTNVLLVVPLPPTDDTARWALFCQGGIVQVVGLGGGTTVKLPLCKPSDRRTFACAAAFPVAVERAARLYFTWAERPDEVMKFPLPLGSGGTAQAQARTQVSPMTMKGKMAVEALVPHPFLPLMGALYPNGSLRVLHTDYDRLYTIISPKDILPSRHTGPVSAVFRPVGRQRGGTFSSIHVLMAGPGPCFVCMWDASVQGEQTLLCLLHAGAHPVCGIGFMNAPGLGPVPFTVERPPHRHLAVVPMLRANEQALTVTAAAKAQRPPPPLMFPHPAIDRLQLSPIVSVGGHFITGQASLASCRSSPDAAWAALSLSQLSTPGASRSSRHRLLSTLAAGLPGRAHRPVVTSPCMAPD